MHFIKFILILPALLVAETPREQFLSRTIPKAEAEALALFSLPESGRVELPLYKPDDVHFPVVELETPDGEPLLALVDTGAGTSLITLDAALRCGAHPVGIPPLQLGARGFGGNARFWIGVLPSLQFGDLTVNNIRLAVHEGNRLPGPPNVGERRIDLLLGYDALQGFDWMEFDPSKPALRFGAGVPAPLDREKTLKLGKKRGGGPQILLAVGSRNDLPVTLDTGGHFGLRLNKTDAESCGLKPQNLITRPQSRKSVGGTSMVMEGPRVRLDLGALSVSNLRTHIAVDAHGNSSHIGSLLGYPVLSRLHWVLDQKAGEVRFKAEVP